MPAVAELVVMTLVAGTPVVAVVAGYVLDGWLGDPRWLPHPVRGIGWLIGAGESRLNRGAPVLRLVLGGLLTLGVVGLVAGVAWALVGAVRTLHPWLGEVITALGVAVLLARRSLAEEAGHAVYRPLITGDLPAARLAVSRVVGRDTAELDPAGVSRASLETIAENASDGVAAPLLFALVGGLPGIAAYKAINTLDSMIGHRDERYRYFGRIAARLDDAANWIPARVTCLAIVVAAALSGRAAGAAWQAARTGAGRHSSPNAGWPEAAMAGALGISLGGVNFYDGEPDAGPVFHPAGQVPQPEDIPSAVFLMHLCCHLILGAGVLLRLLVQL